MDFQMFCASRVLYYDFFANFFLYELLSIKQKTLQKQTDLLSKQPLCDLMVYQTINNHLKFNFTLIQEEYTRLFALPFENSVSLYLSHYKKERMGGETLLDVKMLLKESNFFLDRSFTKENEDHFGILCLFMKSLLSKKDEMNSCSVFEQCIKPIGVSIANNICLQDQNQTYCCVAQILKEFMIFELELHCALT